MWHSTVVIWSNPTSLLGPIYLGPRWPMTIPQRSEMISVSQVKKVLEELPLQSRTLITPTMQAEKNLSSLSNHQAIQNFFTVHHGPSSSIYSKRNERSTPWVTFSNNCNKGYPKRLSPVSAIVNSKDSTSTSSLDLIAIVWSFSSQEIVTVVLQHSNEQRLISSTTLQFLLNFRTSAIP